MIVPKRLTLFVEGPGDVEAAPPLVNRLLSDLGAQDCFYLGPPFKAGDLMDLLLCKRPRLKDFLLAAAKQADLGAVLVLLDGDTRLPPKTTFCPGVFAQKMAEVAREARAGDAFSFAAVFAMREYESWLLAGLEALSGQPLPPENQPGVREGARPPQGNLEENPRDAKGALKKEMISGVYKPTTHQAPLTRLLVKDLSPIRQRGMRSFRRLETSLRMLAEAVRTGQHISIPAGPSPPPVQPPKAIPPGDVPQ